MSADDKHAQTHPSDDFAADDNVMNTEYAEAGPESAMDGQDRIDQLERELEIQTQKAGESLELARRTAAEMDNLRKRTVRDIENAHKYALEKFINELLPVLDSLELGIQASTTAGDIDAIREGMQLTLKKFSDLLEKSGVQPLDPAGQKFNPEKHSAVSMVAAEGTEAGTVISVLQKGYELNGRLVRPAMVVVAS